ncbi:MAG: metal-binding protein [Cyanophyceae cyanobacterium]
MPSGRTHDRITLWCLPWVVGVAFLLTRSGNLTLIVALAFLFSGLMFGPDLDIYSVQFKRWGVLRLIWLPYQKLLSHRSFLSHGLIIGTVGRLLYLGGIALTVAFVSCALLKLAWNINWNWQRMFQAGITFIQTYPEEAITLFLGLELGAASHSLSDRLGSAYRRRQKRKRQKQGERGKGKNK